MTSLVWPDISLKLYFSALRQPTHVTYTNDDSSRLFVAEQRSRILLIQDSQIRKKSFLDITDGVRC
jgi:hypothetical protein